MPDPGDETPSYRTFDNVRRVWLPPSVRRFRSWLDDHPQQTADVIDALEKIAESVYHHGLPSWPYQDVSGEFGDAYIAMANGDVAIVYSPCDTMPVATVGLIAMLDVADYDGTDNRSETTRMEPAR